MSITAVAIAVPVVLILLFVAYKFITGCLPKLVIGLIILGGLAYFAYSYFIK